MIRYLTLADLPWLIQIGKEFNDRHYGIPFDMDRAELAIEKLITEDYGVGFRSDSGGIVGTIEEDPFRNYVVLQERGWYANDRTGIQLLKRFIEEGKALGVDEIRMTTLSNNPRAKLILKRHGFISIEECHGLRLGV